MTWIDRTLLEHAWSALGGHDEMLDRVAFDGPRVLSSRYPVADLASATIATAGLALAEWVGGDQDCPPVHVDRGLAGGWFGMTFTPQGWPLPAAWDAVAGDYRCADGWIRLHTNDRAHRTAALAVLGIPDSDRQPAGRDAVSRDGARVDGRVPRDGCVGRRRVCR